MGRTCRLKDVQEAVILATHKYIVTFHSVAAVSTILILVSCRLILGYLEFGKHQTSIPDPDRIKNLSAA